MWGPDRQLAAGLHLRGFPRIGIESEPAAAGPAAENSVRSGERVFSVEGGMCVLFCGRFPTFIRVDFSSVAEDNRGLGGRHGRKRIGGSRIRPERGIGVLSNGVCPGNVRKHRTSGGVSSETLDGFSVPADLSENSREL